MDNFLMYLAGILLLVVVFGFFNEKITRMPYEISLMVFSVLAGVLILVLVRVVRHVPILEMSQDLNIFNIEAFLMKGVLCFMMFAGSCHMKLRDFKEQFRLISLLAIVGTLLGAIFYGGLFYLLAQLMGFSFTIPVCLMLGSIVAPTDPIAATSILRKFNLPKKIGFAIEGESLFNDGVGVALFVCFSGMVSAENAGGGFLSVMCRELLGAVVTGLVVSVICFQIFRRTKESSRQIFCSLLAVSMSYLLCEVLGFSGAIAAVICGIMFSAMINYNAEKGRPLELKEFDTFWEILDNFLNSILYVMIGLSFPCMLQMPNILILAVCAVVLNLVCRFGSVGITSFITGKLPDNYDRLSFAGLLTWGGLRGGLSMALAMSTAELVSADVYHIILGTTYAVVFFTTIVQGLTMKRVYSKIEQRVKNH